MKKLLHHRVEITDGGKYGSRKNIFEIVEVNVLAENNWNIVLNDRNYTVVKKEKSSYTTCINEKSIGVTANDSFWGNRITYSLYSYSRKRAGTIKKEIEEKINEKFGFYLSGVDLSIIKD